MVEVPAGSFILGLDPGGELSAFMSDRTTSQNSQPSQEVHLDAFHIDIHEVTYGDFLRFKPGATYTEGRFNHPVRGVSWYEAEAYCLWLGKRLPTELEWEKAARGVDGRIYTWGNEFDRNKANLAKTVKPGGSAPTDKSAYGAYDLNGNISEWTASWYQPYPNSTFKDTNYGTRYKVIRGGAINKREHGFSKEFVSLTYRNLAPPIMRSWDTGFRCARNS